METKRNMARGNWLSSIHLDRRLNVAVGLLPAKVDSLLDAGCGEGYFLEKVRKSKPAAKLVGIDKNEDNLDYARIIVPSASFLNADMRSIPFGDSSFDCAACLEVIDHIADYNKVIDEMKRITKKNGTVLFSFPDTSNLLWELVWSLWTKTFGRRWAGEHVNSFDEKKFRVVLARHGFKKINVAKTFFGLILVFIAEVEK